MQQKVNIEALNARRRKVWVTLAKKEIGKVFNGYDIFFVVLQRFLTKGTKSTQQLPQRSAHHLQKVGSTVYESCAEQSYSGMNVMNVKINSPTVAY